MVAPREDGTEAAASSELVLPLHVEDVVVSRRQAVTATVRVATVTHEVDRLVREEIIQQRAEIERVAIGRIVEVAPPIREEGDVTIIPVVEEVVVTQRKLLLKEEIHVRRVRTAEQHSETVVLRRQDVEITRTPVSQSNIKDTTP